MLNKKMNNEVEKKVDELKFDESVVAETKKAKNDLLIPASILLAGFVIATGIYLSKKMILLW